MNEEPRFAKDYSQRQVEAAHRVLVDVGHILASFQDAIVIIGGWVPGLLLPDHSPRHVGSVDLDLALDAEKLADGRYAELLQQLLNTKRYHLGDKPFQMVAQVDLGDGDELVRVEVEFLASKEFRLKGKNLIDGFRVFQFDECNVAFAEPRDISVEGLSLLGAQNTVNWQVVALPDFLVLKAHALKKRDKPKDAYDICYCLEHHPGGLQALAQELSQRLAAENASTVSQAIEFLREKFASANHFGPHQYAEFHNEDDPDERAVHRQRAYALVAGLLAAI